MPVDTSMLAPSMPEEPRQGGMGPGIIEGIKSAIQWLVKQGMNVEEIIETILKLAGDVGTNIPEEEMRRLIQKTAAEGGELPPQQGMRNKLGMGMAAMGEAGRIMEE